MPVYLYSISYFEQPTTWGMGWEMGDVRYEGWDVGHTTYYILLATYYMRHVSCYLLHTTCIMLLATWITFVILAHCHPIRQRADERSVFYYRFLDFAEYCGVYPELVERARNDNALQIPRFRGVPLHSEWQYKNNYKNPRIKKQMTTHLFFNTVYKPNNNEEHPNLF